MISVSCGQMTQFFFLTGSMSGLRLFRRHIHSSDTDYKQRRSHRGRHGGQCNKRTTHDGSGKVASDTRDLRETLEAVGDTSSSSELVDTLFLALTLIRCWVLNQMHNRTVRQCKVVNVRKIKH